MRNDEQLVQHKSVSVLARVKGPDPDDDKRVIITPLIDPKPFSCAKEHLIFL